MDLPYRDSLRTPTAASGVCLDGGGTKTPNRAGDEGTGSDARTKIILMQADPFAECAIHGIRDRTGGPNTLPQTALDACTPESLPLTTDCRLYGAKRGDCGAARALGGTGRIPRAAAAHTIP